MSQLELLTRPEWATLDEARQVALGCTRCDLHQSRTQVVFASGNPQSGLMFIGEGPGQTEDETGVPFVGRAGQLLTKIIESVGLNRDTDVYITNVVKCRPPGNRVPTEHEMNTCSSYLKAQLYFIRPKIVVLVGATALKGVLGIQTPISRIRGTWLETPFDGAQAMAIYHPSYLLRNPSSEKGTPKWQTWQDIQEIRRVYDAWVQQGRNPLT